MINNSYGWHWQYLTIIGLSIAMATFIFGFLADLTLSPQLFSIKNTLSLCSAPLEVLISILYWGISAIDRRLVVPPEIHIAPLADIGFHAMPSILLTIDLLFLSPPWTIHAFPAMGLSSVIAVSYWAWVEQCFRHNGLYVTFLLASCDWLTTFGQLSLSSFREARYSTKSYSLRNCGFDDDGEYSDAAMALWLGQWVAKGGEAKSPQQHQGRVMINLNLEHGGVCSMIDRLEALRYND